MLKIKRNNIIEHLHLNKMSITDLAKKAEVNTKTIYNLINNRNTPNLSLAKTIANILNTTIEALFSFENEH